MNKAQVAEKSKFQIPWKTVIIFVLVVDVLLFLMSLLRNLLDLLNQKKPSNSMIDILLGLLVATVLFAALKIGLIYLDYWLPNRQEKDLDKLYSQLSSTIDEVLKPGEMIDGKTLLHTGLLGEHLLLLTQTRLLWIKVKRIKKQAFPAAAISLSVKDITKTTSKTQQNTTFLHVYTGKKNKIAFRLPECDSTKNLISKLEKLENRHQKF